MYIFKALTDVWFHDTQWFARRTIQIRRISYSTLLIRNGNGNNSITILLL